MDDTEPQDNPIPKNKGRLHGVTLKMILERLVEQIGWEEMAYRVNVNCFKDRPTINSSLKLLRQTPWAREKVERLYLRHNPDA
jgi:uncharacterized protein (DUF2132 family)